MEGNPYELGEDEIGELLPPSLEAALEALSTDEIVRRSMGPKPVDLFLMIKRYELHRWRARQARMTEWERAEYAHHL